MNLQMLISPKIQRITEKTGEITLLIVSVVLMANYYRMIDLNKLGVPFLCIFLWIYLLLNIGLANIFKYYRNKDNPICPKCRKKLIENKEYECTKCGVLNFDKK